MKVRFLDTSLYPAYHEFLNRQDACMLYYSLPYKNLLEDFLQCDSLYAVAIEYDRIYGILPLMKRSGKYGDVLNSLPFYGSNGGVIAENKEARSVLCDFYNHFVQDFASATYITHPLLTQHDNIAHDVIDERIGQWNALCPSEQLWLQFESSARRNIAKAKREGVEVRVVCDIDFLYETHFDNITSIGGIPKERRFFDQISKHCEWGKDYKIYVAYYQSQPIAALLLFYYGQIIEYYTPATVHKYRTLQALPLLIFVSMEEGYLAGYSWWNWGGSWASQGGVYRFKKKFGGVQKPYVYFTKINNDQFYTSSKEELLKEYPYFYVLPFEALKGV